MSGCPVGEAAMGWTVLVATSPVPFADTALTEAGIRGQLTGDTLGVGSSRQDKPLQRDWEEGVNQLLDCHYRQVERDSKKVVVTSAIAWNSEG